MGIQIFNSVFEKQKIVFNNAKSQNIQNLIELIWNKKKSCVGCFLMNVDKS